MHSSCSAARRLSLSASGSSASFRWGARAFIMLPASAWLASRAGSVTPSACSACIHSTVGQPADAAFSPGFRSFKVCGAGISLT